MKIISNSVINKPLLNFRFSNGLVSKHDIIIPFSLNFRTGIIRQPFEQRITSQR